MNASRTGLLAGLILGLAAMSGWITFVVVLVAGVIGFIAGRVVDGDVSLADLLGRGRDR
jgi:fructose-specific phosphotransferase system IIC component